MPEPGSAADVRFAARIVVEGLLPQETMRAVLAKQKELLERGKLLGVADICVRKGWLTPAEARWLESPERPDPELLPGLHLGPQIGQGGMSRVYAARQDDPNRAVAVKVLLPRLRRQEPARARFRAEAELLCKLDHRNLVRGWSFNTHDEVDYLVMELVDGKTALELLDARGPFSEADALHVIVQAAQALEYLHSKGFVHRDVKPGNLLVGPKNAVKVCDLGFAVESGGGGGASTAGTVQYLAPEQATGEGGLDCRADIYALGVTLFQLVLGKLPFDGVTDEEQLTRRLTEELRAKELKGLGVSQHLHYFIQKMTARDRSVRYQSPADLIADVGESMQGRAEADGRGGDAAVPGRNGRGRSAPHRSISRRFT